MQPPRWHVSSVVQRLETAVQDTLHSIYFELWLEKRVQKKTRFNIQNRFSHGMLADFICSLCFPLWTEYKNERAGSEANIDS